jgi:ribonuclease Z
LEFKILGTGSATPLLDRNPSAFMLSIDNYLILIDCGEGVQQRFLQHKIKYSRINHIFISHLHGDHYFGLIGLISSFNMNKRTEPLYIFGPNGLNDIISMQLKLSNSKLNFNLVFTIINPEVSETIIENDVFKIDTIPLKHRVPCTGFLVIKKASKRKILSNLLPENFPISYIKRLVDGENVFDELSGKSYLNIDYTAEGNKEKRFAYCSDTIFDLSIIDKIMNVDLLYHEATFLTEQQNRAEVTYHSTAAQAAQIAAKANVKKLIIGHFSSRYKTLEQFYIESTAVFVPSHLAVEGESYII